MTGVGEMTRTWWIDEEKLAGSPNPTEDELRSLRSKGFVSIICLLDRTEQAPKYDPDVAEKMGYSWHCIPIRDFAAPTPDQFQEFQRLVEQALPKGKVLVHCQGGSGRTGTMGAAYWILKGSTVKQACEKVRQARLGAVETPEQKDSLRKLEDAHRQRSVE